ncbi:MAG: LysR family transcriptional regulator [Pseudomonadota bacterium]
MDSITLHQLTVFAQVCALGSFTQAADHLNVAQPALSRQIKNLEEQLGIILLDRTARPLKPTREGARILSCAHDVLNALERLTNTAKQARSRSKRTLAIGFVGSALVGALPRALKQLNMAASDVDVSMVELSSAEQIAALKSGEIHIGFGRIMFDDSEIRQIILKRETLIAAAATGSAFVCDTHVSLKQRLERETVLSYPRTPSPNYVSQVRAGLKANAIEPKRIQALVDLQSALSLAAAGMGIAIIPASVGENPRHDIEYVDISSLEMTSPVTVNCPLERMKPDAQALLEKVMEVSGVSLDEEL